MAIFWAAVNLFFAAFNDMVFKGYARKPRSHGLFVTIVGVIWFISAACCVTDPVKNWRATLFWGAVSGFFSVGGNMLMLDAMRKLDAGICATIYRLNLVPAVLLAYFILAEPITLLQWGGIVCACLAVLAFIPRGGDTMRRELTLSLVFMITASLMRAGMGISYRYGFTHCGASEQVVPVINSVFWVVGGLVYALLRERSELKALADRKACRKLLGYGILSGALVAGIVVTMAKSLSLGHASVVLPIMQMSFLLTGILSVIFLKEKITFMKVLALLLGVAAVLLLSIK
ncbi:MAG: DMT family transporter [Lentisphaeria bacterium]|nr:DMT family transporter [Lentisphaeria bacterium]